MKKQVIFLLLMVLLLNVSCQKFLMEDPKSQISNTNFYQTDADAIAAIDGVYERMRLDITNGVPPIYLPEMISDDGTMSASATQVLERIELDNMIYNSQHSIINTVWTNAYNTIDRANNVLQFVQDSTKITPSLIRRIHAEARFLRAFNNFRLVQLFGDIPLMTRVANVREGNLYPSRTPQVQVYNSIIEDLKYAESHLDTTYAYTNSRNGGRATVVAAKALLGKVYLTMAGYPLNDVSKYQLAADKLKEIIDNKVAFNVDLNPVYANIFTNLVATKALDRERIFYRRGTSGLPSGLHAFTRMGQTFRNERRAVPSRDFSLFTFTPTLKTYTPNVGATRVASIEVDNAISGALPIGFDFKFGDVVYSNFFMSSNGFISFSSASANTAPNISNTTLPVIGPLMDDLNGTGGTASYQLTGTAPNRMLIIEWRNWRSRSSATNNISFQVVLNESGDIEFNYDQTAPFSTATAAIGVRFPTFYIAIRNSVALPNFNWAASTTTYVSNNGGFQKVAADNTTTSLLIDQNSERRVFEHGDLRRNNTVDALGTIVTKYVDGGPDSSDDFIWLRYSDVLLMYAEAKIAIGGTDNLDEALAIINSVRAAHGGPLLSAYTYSSQSDLMDKLRLERRREFAFEAHRWYDIKRWNILVPAIKGHLAYQYRRPLSFYDEIVTSKANVLPIPFTEVVSNPQLTQNPGYN